MIRGDKLLEKISVYSPASRDRGKQPAPVARPPETRAIDLKLFKEVPR
jgi:hypothetical protein